MGTRDRSGACPGASWGTRRLAHHASPTDSRMYIQGAAVASTLQSINMVVHSFLPWRQTAATRTTQTSQIHTRVKTEAVVRVATSSYHPHHTTLRFKPRPPYNNR